MAIVVGMLVLRLFHKNDELKEKNDVIVREIRRNQKLIDKAVQNGVNRAAMLTFALLCMMATMTLTSCDMEFSSGGDDGNPEEYQAQVANSRWQLAEVMNQNNEWVKPEFYPGLDIPLLSYSYDNSYFMRICKSADRTDVSLINGTYSVDRNFSITMTDCNYQGISYTLKVTSLNGNTLEGEFILWRQEQRRYTIRMKRTEK